MCSDENLSTTLSTPLDNNIFTCGDCYFLKNILVAVFHNLLSSGVKVLFIKFVRLRLQILDKALKKAKKDSVGLIGRLSWKRRTGEDF